MSLDKKLFTGILVSLSVAYKLTENMAFMKPVVTWLNGKIGGDTLIELLLGALVVYLLLSQGEKEVTVTEPAGQSLSQNPVQTLSPTIDASQHHHYHNEPQKEEPPQPPTPVRRRKLNVVGKKGRIAWLNDVGGGLYEPEDNGSFKTVIAEFRNEPGEFSIITWHHVRASIVFYDGQGVEVADVGRATWLDGYGPTVDLASLVTRKLIVAILTEKWLSFDGGDTKPLSTDIRKAKIVLQDDREFSVPFLLEVDLNLGVVGSLTSLTPPTNA
jgi:hypothetical protein